MSLKSDQLEILLGVDDIMANIHNFLLILSIEKHTFVFSDYVLAMFLVGGFPPSFAMDKLPQSRYVHWLFFGCSLFVCFFLIFYLLSSMFSHCGVNKSNRKAMNRNRCNQKANPALKTKTGNK